jgi:monomeric sarcosine oxidase
MLAGPGDGEIISGVRRAARAHEINLQDLTPTEASDRFPGFVFDPEMEVLFEPEGGFLDVEGCLEGQAQQAIEHGASILEGQQVRSWSQQRGTVSVSTADHTFVGQSLIICGGAWNAQLLAELGMPLTVRRKPVLWYEPKSSLYEIPGGCPVFGFDLTDGFFYGFPNWNGQGVKVGNHSGGQEIRNVEEMDRSLQQPDQNELDRFLESHLPQCGTAMKAYSICMYSMTPDEHFIVDRHPRFDNLFFAAGFSGHGFKFAPIIGKALADLSIDGQTSEPIGFLSASRPSLRSA